MKIIFKIFLVLVIMFVLSGIKKSYAQEKKVIEIVPYGNIDEEVVKHIRTKLRDILGINVSIGQGEMMPFDAYNNDRKQYESSAIIKEILKKKKDVNKNILAVIDADLYTSELNFVFGEADKASGIAIVSLTRLRETYYGFLKNKKLFFLRILKEVMHEVGHLYEFDHCPNPICVMHFSNRLSDTDKKDYEFCDVCLGKKQQ